jgi:hypothetical protein
MMTLTTTESDAMLATLRECPAPVTVDADLEPVARELVRRGLVRERDGKFEAVKEAKR